MMAEQLPELPNVEPNLPRVIVAERVIEKIVRVSPLYPGFETGETMIGLIFHHEGRTEPDIYILDTLSPGEDAIRQWGMFEQGSEQQGEIGNWLAVNWEAMRNLHRASSDDSPYKWDVPLSFVGDWHKQPGDMVAPSGGDLATAQAQIADPDTREKQLVAPIVTMYRVPPVEDTEAEQPESTGVAPVEASAASPEASAEANIASSDITTDDPVIAPSGESADADDVQAVIVTDVDGAKLLIVEEDALMINETAAPPDPDKLPPNALIRTTADQEWVIRIDFWYLSTQTPRFVPVVPTVWADDQLPTLPLIAWHLQHERRYQQEVKLLTDAEYIIDVREWDADGQPPYEICFYVYKPGSWNVYILVTSVDYPNQMPAMRVSPLVSVADDEDLFEKVYEASRPLLLDKQPDWEWDSKRTLIELVWHIEKTMKNEEKA